MKGKWKGVREMKQGGMATCDINAKDVGSNIACIRAIVNESDAFDAIIFPIEARN